MGGHGHSDDAVKLTVCQIIVKVIQYIIGFAVSSLAFFYEFYGIFQGYGHVTVVNQWPIAGVFILLVVLITILAYCEATQVALMIIEKVDPKDLGEGWLMDYAKKGHALAKSNVNNYLIGRQIFVTCIVMMTAELIHLDHSYIGFCKETLGPFIGSEVLVSIFVRSGLCGSLILLAVGQLIPELTVTTNPTFMFRMPPAYEIIWANLWCERLGICQFSEIMASLCRWALSLPDDDMFRAGATETQFKARAVAGDAEEDDAEEDSNKGDYSRCGVDWPAFFAKDSCGTAHIVFKTIVGCAVMGASTFGMFWYVTTGGSPWCPTTRPQCNGKTMEDWDWQAEKLEGPLGCAPQSLTWKNTLEVGVGTTTYPDFHYNKNADGTLVAAVDADGNPTGGYTRTFNTWAAQCLDGDHKAIGFDGSEASCDKNNGAFTKGAYEHCICPQWVLLALVVPLMSILLMFLEGSQIAVLALEKAPGRQIKRMHRPAYFGHKVSQARDNVRRYLLGRQFLVVFGDFVAAKCYGLYGIGFIVIVEVFPRLVALKNPMYWLGTWGSRFVLLLALLVEFLGFTHFAWGLYEILNYFIHSCCGVEDDAFSVGEAIDLGDDKEGSLGGKDHGELMEIIYELRDKIGKFDGTIDRDAAPAEKAAEAEQEKAQKGKEHAREPTQESTFAAEENTETGANEPEVLD